MCYHLYTDHACGHQGVRVEQCGSILMPTGALFCEIYHVRRATSIKQCGGMYCKEDKETADWIENGPSRLLACVDQVTDLRRRLERCQREKKARDEYQASWGLLQGEKEVARADELRQKILELLKTYEELQNKHKFIVSGINKARQTLNNTTEAFENMVKQQQAAKLQAFQQHQAAMQALNLQRQKMAMQAQQQQFILQVQQPPINPFCMPAVDNAVPNVVPQRAMTSPRQSFQTPQQLLTDMPTQQLVSSANRQNIFRQLLPTGIAPKVPSLPQFSPPSLTSLKSAIDAEKPAAVQRSPLKKGTRGGPPKVKQPPAFASAVGIIPAPSTNGSQITPIKVKEKPQTRSRAKRGSNKEADTEKLLSSGTRRSGRLSNKRVSYAESSSSSSPSPESSPYNSVAYQPKTVIATGKPPARSTRSARTKGKKAQKDDEEFAFEEEDIPSDDENAEDDEWKYGDEDQQPDDATDFEPSPVKKTRSSNKRSAETAVDARRPKRQALKAPVTPVYNHPQGLRDQSAPENDIGAVLKVTAPEIAWDTINWPAYRMPSSLSAAQMNAPAPFGLNATPTVSLRGGQASFSTMPETDATNPMTPTSMAYTAHSLMGNGAYDPVGVYQNAQGQDAVAGAELSPLRQLDLINGLRMEDDITMGVGEGLVDTNDYDFDVGAMSRIAGLGGQNAGA